MKKLILVLSILTLCQSAVLTQDKYPLLLDKVDLTNVQQSPQGMIPENTVQYDPTVADIINQANLDSLVSFARILSGEDSVWIGSSKVLIRNRGGTGGNLAADYIKRKLSSYNLEVYEQNYGSTGKNVYAVQEGYLYPEEQYIICAHYDAVDVYCADDNASGTAAVIEAARILSNYGSKYTLVYALWDEEEIGLIGSNYFASQAASNQDQIKGVLNMDMLAWDGNNDNLIDIHTQNTGESNDLANMLVIVNWMYALQLNPVIYNPGTWQSDHSAFWNYGIGAVLLIEAYYGNDLNPYYHGIDDRIDKFNLPYFHKLSKLSIGTISTLVEVTQDTLIASVTPTVGYQTYQSKIQIKGYNTHFLDSSNTLEVWLSKDAEKITSDSVVIETNTLLNAYFNFSSTAQIGLWDVNVECSINGIITKEDCFNILPPPAIIVVSPDSFFVELLAGSTSTEIFTISNEGETNLYFDVSAGFGSNNYALQFDGVDDMVVGPATQFPVGNNNRTIELWFNRTSQPFEEGILMGYGGLGWDSAGGCYGMTIHQSDHWFWSQWGERIDANTIIQNNHWYHAAVVSVFNDVILYTNGELDGTGNRYFFTYKGTPYYIGKAPLGYDEFRRLNGIIDEVRIWDVARTQQEIQQYMHKQLTGTEPGLVGYWQFNEGIGMTAYDKTGNAQNGSLQGGVNWINSLAPIRPSWLTNTPDSGICLPNSSMDIEILFDATELDSGNYFTSMIINSSDPFTPSIIIPVHLMVEPVVDVEDELNIPTVYELFQNYPNPFNPSTTIKYSIPKVSKVKLTIFNLLGEEVTTLVNEEKVGGNYSVEFNASLLPNGVYFYRIQAGNFIDTKKMLLLK